MMGEAIVDILAIKGTEEVPLCVEFTTAESRLSGKVPWGPLVDINLRDGINTKG